MNDVQASDILKLLEESEVEADLDGLDPAVSLLEQGLDSLDMMNVYFQVEEKYGISVAENSIAAGEWDSLDKIAASINSHSE